MAAMPRLLWLFCLANLIIGSGAFVIGGILAPIASDLDVTIAAAGQAMTAYALSTALLAPLALVATGRWSRKRTLLALLLAFTLGNVLCALATTLPALLAGRVLMGIGAAFTPVAAGMAVAMVEAPRRGQALALVFMGMSLSYAVGVPLGSWLGLSHGWHTPLWVVVVACVLALAAVMAWVPSGDKAANLGYSGMGALLARRDVLAVLLMTLLYFIAIFVVFSYIGPVLQALVPMGRERQSVTLALFGVSGVAGTLVGGACNDRFGSLRTLRVLLAVLGTTMLLLPLTAGSWPALMITLVVWGCAGFGLMVPQQSRLAALAPAQAPLLLSLNTSMLYLGTAFGAVVGGAAAARLGLAQLAWAGAPFVAVCLVMALAGHTLQAAALVPRQESER